MKTSNKIINLPNDFTKFTGLRYESLTEGISGERFREEFLIPALDEFESITVVFDGNIGEYLPSFLEECFGGLIRKKKYSLEEFNKVIKIVSEDDPSIITDIIYYVQNEINK